ncbi:hypothetical protein FQP90_13445 [Paenarthrobacter nitroguajacolicus]|uniref:Uncharacterized protein n=1 Tax=Paenarthrobacter nitroguajacolicus TaxID=211146 RepID=A0A558GXC5_PAENT|nr:hypothetical protein [Paenarthrobacter nitroguajacolicus]TVU61540.1 hypothetical protein FQP90_13445 [Paenarthrobacter nitroguajacolicus]
MEKPAIVRIFPDYADTVLWLDRPVDYELAGLTPSLEQELKDWEQFYYDSLTRDFAWKAPDLPSFYAAEGNRLAQRLADELGDGYEVQFTPYEENAVARRFRGTKSPNSRAVAAFDALVAAARAEQDRISRALAAHPPEEGTGWFAASPLSGNVFKPPRAGQE